MNKIKYDIRGRKNIATATTIQFAWISSSPFLSLNFQSWLANQSNGKFIEIEEMISFSFSFCTRCISFRSPRALISPMLSRSCGQRQIFVLWLSGGHMAVKSILMNKIRLERHSWWSDVVIPNQPVKFCNIRIINIAGQKKTAIGKCNDLSYSLLYSQYNQHVMKHILANEIDRFSLMYIYNLCSWRTISSALFRMWHESNDSWLAQSMATICLGCDMQLASQPTKVHKWQRKRDII